MSEVGRLMLPCLAWSLRATSTVPCPSLNQTSVFLTRPSLRLLIPFWPSKGRRRWWLALDIAVGRFQFEVACKRTSVSIKYCTHKARTKHYEGPLRDGRVHAPFAGATARSCLYCLDPPAHLPSQRLGLLCRRLLPFYKFTRTARGDNAGVGDERIGG